MTYNELSDTISSSVDHIVNANKKSLTRNMAAITTYSKSNDEFKDAMLSLFMASVELGAMASIRTLAELGYLNISE
ncbi:MAG: hypothetical protein NC434_10880 [Ruminococcus sp.]|nr:hypothetical protein [Ruminococcus sp.]